MEKAGIGAAVVTGASSGIGLEISRRLCELGYEVHGIGRDFSGAMADEGMRYFAEQGRFCPVVCDVLETDRLCALVRDIAAHSGVSVLVNNAGIGYYGLHEELGPKKISMMVRTNLEVPLILTQQLLRSLKKNAGFVINISSVTAKQSSPHGCAYGATKAGLAGFSRSLSDEVRRYGVKVVTVFPDMTKTGLYRNADFGVGEEEDSYLLPEDVADAVQSVLTARDGVVITEVALRPQIHRIQRKRRGD